MVPSLPYRHSQRVPLLATLGFAALMLLLVGGAALVVLREEGAYGRVHMLAALVVLLVLAYALVAFRELSIEVRAGEVRLAFGSIGPRKRIRLARVAVVRATRSRPLYGWGIRWVPGGWMWNVWGLDAVELELGSGKRFLIGTDRPGELATAIEMARRARA